MIFETRTIELKQVFNLFPSSHCVYFHDTLPVLPSLIVKPGLSRSQLKVPNNSSHPVCSNLPISKSSKHSITVLLVLKVLNGCFPIIRELYLSEYQWWGCDKPSD